MRAVRGPLYHYTCSHAHELIGEQGLLKPANQLSDSMPPWFWPAELVWLTDLKVPQRYALGLTMTLTPCDRTECRYRVAVSRRAAGIEPWVLARRRYLHGDLPEIVDALEGLQGARPGHWYIARRAVPVVLDPPAVLLQP